MRNDDYENEVDGMGQAKERDIMESIDAEKVTPRTNELRAEYTRDKSRCCGSWTERLFCELAIMEDERDRLNLEIDRIKDQDIAVYDAAWKLVQAFDEPYWKDDESIVGLIDRLRAGLCSSDNTETP